MFQSKSEEKPSPATSNRLEEFILLAKSARGAAAIDLVKRVTEAPGVYTFGELLEMPGIQELGNGPNQIWLEFLRLFAYGTVKTYKERANEFPPLTVAQLQKLRHLTIVTLATREKSIPYVKLQEALEVASLRELEDLIIESCYAGIIQGKLDQKRSMVQVSFAIGRDIEVGDKKLIISTLTDWCETCETLMVSLQNQIQIANQACEAHEAAKTALETKIVGIKATQRLQREDGDSGDCCDMLSPAGRSTPTFEKGSKKGPKTRSGRGSSAGGPGSSRWQMK